MPGYSGKPLWRKLGLKAGTRLALVDAPPGAETLLLGHPEPLRITAGARGRPDISLVFVRTVSQLKRRVETTWKLAHPVAAVWICWPKKSSPLFIDLSEDGVRELLLPRGLVDVKVCAVDDDWSGLKVVVRKELRA